MTESEMNERIDRLRARLRDNPEAGKALIAAFYRGNSAFEDEWKTQLALANLSPASWDEHIERVNARNGFGATDEATGPSGQ